MSVWTVICLPLLVLTSEKSPFGVYDQLALDVFEGVSCVFVCLAPFDLERDVAYGAGRVVALVVAFSAPWGNGTPGTSNKSCLSRLEAPVVDWPVDKVVVVFSLVFCVVFAACNNLDMVEVYDSSEYVWVQVSYNVCWFVAHD